jgi:hypothetical protein
MWPNARRIAASVGDFSALCAGATIASDLLFRFTIGIMLMPIGQLCSLYPTLSSANPLISF